MLCEAAVLLHEEEEEGGRFKSQRGFFFPLREGGGERRRREGLGREEGRGEEGEGLGRVNIHGGFGRRKKGGRETEGARDWLPLPAPSHLTASLSASQSGAAAVFERCQREEEEELKKKINVLPEWMCSGCSL